MLYVQKYNVTEKTIGANHAAVIHLHLQKQDL